MKTTKKKVTVRLVETAQENTEKHEFTSERHEENEHGGYSDHDVTIDFYEDGSLSFTGDILEGEFVYLYPEQVKHLESVLRKRNTMLKGKRNV